MTEVVSLAHDLSLPLLDAGVLPVSRPHVKLLFGSSADATFAGASITTTSIAVSVLGHPSAIGPRDGAFVIVAPSSAERSVDTEAALRDLLQVAAARLVVVVNPRMGNSPVLGGAFEHAYLMRPLSLSYLRDQFSKQVERVPACLLRCYPHEWSVLVDTRRNGGEWQYAGRFDRQPQPAQIEQLLQQTVTRAVDAARRAGAE